jgi:hypothetical protein
LAAAGLGPVIAFIRAIGVICHDTPHLVLHQPHMLSSPPLPTMAFQYLAAAGSQSLRGAYALQCDAAKRYTVSIHWPNVGRAN